MEVETTQTKKGWSTVAELAESQTLKRVTIWSWVRSGRLKVIRVGAQIRIMDEDWREFMRMCNEPKK